MRTTTFTFHYWDSSETIHHSFDVFVLTHLTDPPFTPKLDVIRMFTSPFTVIPSTAPVFDVLTTYIFETFTSIPPRLDSTGIPIHFTFRGAHFDTLIQSPHHTHRIGDIYRLEIAINNQDDSHKPDHADILLSRIELIDQTPHNDLVLTEPPPLEICHYFVTMPTIHHFCCRFLSVPTIMPPHSFIDLPHVRTIDGLVNWDHSHTTFIGSLGYPILVDISAVAMWNVSHIDCLASAFQDCQFLTDITAVTEWDTSNVTNMIELFSGCESLTDLTPISSWNTSKVSDMSGMFSSCESLTDLTPISSWNTSKVVNMNSMFSSCESLTDLTPISSWDTSKVINMHCMFNYCKSIRDVNAIAEWDTSSVMNLHFMFANCTGLIDISGLAKWNTSNVMNIRSMICECTQIDDTTSIERWAIPLVRNNIHEKLRDITQLDIIDKINMPIKVGGELCYYDYFMDLIGDDVDDEIVNCIVKRLFLARNRFRR